MSPTTLRPGARALGALLLSAALVGTPTVALADETPTATPSPTATADRRRRRPARPPRRRPPRPPRPAPRRRHGHADPVRLGTPTAAPSPDRTASRLPRRPPASRAAARLAAAARRPPRPGRRRTSSPGPWLPTATASTTPARPSWTGASRSTASSALVASGTGGDQVAASLAYLEDHVGGYMGRDYASTYAGPTAKAIIGILAAGGTTSDVSTLVSELRATEGPSRPAGSPTCRWTAGTPCATTRTPSASPSPSSRWCAPGRPRAPSPSPTSPPSSAPTAASARSSTRCPVRPTQTPPPSPPRRSSPSARDRPRGFRPRLARRPTRTRTGSFDNSEGQLNTNTTGVAAQAFAAGGRDSEVAKAQAFIATLQYGCSAAPALRGAHRLHRGRPVDRHTHGLRPAGQRTGHAWASPVSRCSRCRCPARRPPAPPASPARHRRPRRARTSRADDRPGGDVRLRGRQHRRPAWPRRPRDRSPRPAPSRSLPVLLGLALLALGALAVLASRTRRGAHA